MDIKTMNQGVRLILKAFRRYHIRFQAITVRAEARFRGRDWQGMRLDAKERLSLYKWVLDRLVDEMKAFMGGAISDRNMWARMKKEYAHATEEFIDWELAQTWFNSVTRCIFSTIGVDSRIEFTASGKQMTVSIPARGLYRTYTSTSNFEALFTTILSYFHRQIPFYTPERDAGLIAGRVEDHLSRIDAPRFAERVDVVDRVFYRGMGAYIVGRMYCGSHKVPLVIAVLNGPDGIFSDAVLLAERDLSVLFSFTRSAFHVENDCPHGLVGFIKSLLPQKKTAEIYTAIGHGKHGKTALFRDLQTHIASCGTERFAMAPGKRGMVMEVFGMPNYDVVFKLIKDRFAFPKTSTRREVMEKYELVFMHDRAGRLVEATSFEYLTFDPCCFSDELLRELLKSAGATIHVGTDRITIDHAYVERRVVPLDLFLRAADTIAAHDAVMDFGNAIKDLAKSNIFPGDFLLKNFGVTRHGRVVFYDYDELCFLTECHFRKMPAARSDDDEYSSQPWYYVGENDVFPEEFEKFLGLSSSLMTVFKAKHADLFDIDFWRETQQTILSGQLCHIFSYSPEIRFDHPRESVCELWDAGCMTP